jgi:hypothetical protein
MIPKARDFILITPKHGFRTAEERMEFNMIEFAKQHVKQITRKHCKMFDETWTEHDIQKEATKYLKSIK